jgi:hypothetical protein
MLAGLGIKSAETRRITGFDEFLAALEPRLWHSASPWSTYMETLISFAWQAAVWVHKSALQRKLHESRDDRIPGYALGAGSR